MVLALDRDSPTKEGKPGAADVAILAAARTAIGTCIEVLDGRPPIGHPGGKDINDIFRHAGGGGDGARAVMAIIEGAAPFSHPDYDRERAAADQRAELHERARAAAASAMTRQATAPRPSPSAKDVGACLRRLAEAAPESARGGVLEAAATLLSSSYLPWAGQRARLRAIERAVSKNSTQERARLSQPALAIFERYRTIAPEGVAISAAARSLTQSCGLAAAAFVFELADLFDIPGLDLLSLLGFVHGVHRADKAWLESTRIDEAGKHRADPAAKKSEALEMCGSFEREHRLESSGDPVKKAVEVCSAGECAFCQPHYLREMTAWLRSESANDGAGWRGRYILGFVEAAASDPDSVEAAFHETEHILREPSEEADVAIAGFRAFKCVAAPELGQRAGILFVAELDHAGIARRSFERVMRGTLVELDGPAALERIARSQAALALQTSTGIIQRDPEVTRDPWLGRTTMSLHRGNVDAMPWLAIRPWKLKRRELLGVAIDDRPQWIQVSHTESGVVIDERHSSTPPLHHHELIQAAHANPELCEWRDSEARRHLPPDRAQLVTEARRLSRESRRRRFAAIEIDDRTPLDPRLIEYAAAMTPST